MTGRMSCRPVKITITWSVGPDIFANSDKRFLTHVHCSQSSTQLVCKYKIKRSNTRLNSSNSKAEKQKTVILPEEGGGSGEENNALSFSVSCLVISVTLAFTTICHTVKKNFVFFMPVGGRFSSQEET